MSADTLSTSGTQDRAVGRRDRGTGSPRRWTSTWEGFPAKTLSRDPSESSATTIARGSLIGGSRTSDSSSTSKRESRPSGGRARTAGLSGSTRNVKGGWCVMSLFGTRCRVPGVQERGAGHTRRRTAPSPQRSTVQPTCSARFLAATPWSRRPPRFSSP